MEALKERILCDGENLGRGILKVDSFINHQVDAALMLEAGEELAARFADIGATKVLTAEISGIAPALTTALAPVGSARADPLRRVPGFAKLSSGEQKVARAALASQTCYAPGHDGTLAAGVGRRPPCRTARRLARYVVFLASKGLNAAQLGQVLALRRETVHPKKVHRISAAGAPRLGDPKAPVTIVEYADYQCPHCAEVSPLLERGGILTAFLPDLLWAAIAFASICLANAMVLRSLGVETPIPLLSLAVVLAYFAGVLVGAWGGVGMLVLAIWAAPAGAQEDPPLPVPPAPYVAPKSDQTAFRRFRFCDSFTTALKTIRWSQVSNLAIGWYLFRA